MKITPVRAAGMTDSKGQYCFWTIGGERDVNSWFSKSAAEIWSSGVTKTLPSEFFSRYQSVVLREIRRGAFIYLDQALELLDTGPEEARAAVRLSLEWALKKAHEENNQAVADRIIVAMVIEDL